SCVLDYGATGDQAFADTGKTQEQASAISTPWHRLAGLEHEIVGPASIVATPDRTLHVAIMSEPTNSTSQPGLYAETGLDASDRQGPVRADQPRTELDYAPLLAAGHAGLRLFGFTDIWPVSRPPGTSPRGLMSWQSGTAADWLPGAHGPATGYA